MTRKPVFTSALLDLNCEGEPGKVAAQVSAVSAIMKLQKLLIFSLLLNLCLLALVIYILLARNSPMTESRGGAEKVAAGEARPTAGVPQSQKDWMAIRSQDWKQFVRNLRSTGCPEDTVEDIIFTEVNASYAARWRSRNGEDVTKYWVSKREGWWGHTKQKEFNTLEREKKELIEELLGVNADAQLRKYLVLNYDASLETRQLDFLPPDKKEKITKALDKDDKAIQTVWLKQEPGGGLPQAAQHELNLALQQRKEDLTTMLSAAELQEYELRNSALAKDLRRQLYGFDATEREFRSIFAAQKKLHDKFAEVISNPTDETMNQQRAVAAEAAEKEIRTALGEKRYAEYLRTKNVQYQQLLNFTDEFELTRDTANKAYEIIRRGGERLGQLRADKSLSIEERQAKSAAVASETEAALAQTIGEKGLKYYKQNYGGWMTNATR